MFLHQTCTIYCQLHEGFSICSESPFDARLPTTVPSYAFNNSSLLV